ncbi:MAG TPA: glutamine--fructose-6-phosphate transaminase (isomerizing) [Thermoanaerobaculia bacterium]|jgi:glucosamine--fructose-6-phosphate aminotransferase (isomerizing)|nr:glutamine--fructose-6-phosphate transaminase (isomerizing) [Thermoanaerobaculia bacterium]
MCGIVGYVGGREATPVLLDGLKRLEYRGYDSAGIAVFGDDGVVRVARSEGKLGNLTGKIAKEPPPGRFGVGHTRWATHGRPSEENAHPHRDASGRVVVIHNGIIENFLPMKQRLQKEGVRFLSETDTEVVAQALGAAQRAEPKTPFAEIVRKTAASFEGMFALVLFSADEPGVLYALKWGPPIVLGLGNGENFIASDATALLPHTRDLIFLEDGDLARVTASGVTVTGFDGTPRERPSRRVPWDAISAEKGGYPHYMAKEIAEQPTVVVETIGNKLSLETGLFNEEEMGVPRALLGGIDRVQIVACGTSWHAGLVGKFLLEEIARVQADVDYASEFRYRSPLVDGKTLVLGISQSGETADTVAALKEARRLGARTIGLVNVPGSAIARMVDGVIATHAGPEIGVASTKAFTTQLVALALFSHYVKAARASGDAAVDPAFLAALARLPGALREALALEPEIEKVARRLERARDVLFLGRGAHYPIALEGALKLKEISYLHAEGYPGGEMKHGPIALIDDELPVIGIAPDDALYEKIASNLREAKARDGVVIALVNPGDADVVTFADAVLTMPKLLPALQPIVSVVPLQLLAYHVARRRGCDVDQPRNLAKSVTVE